MAVTGMGKYFPYKGGGIWNLRICCCLHDEMSYGLVIYILFALWIGTYGHYYNPLFECFKICLWGGRVPALYGVGELYSGVIYYVWQGILSANCSVCMCFVDVAVTVFINMHGILLLVGQMELGHWLYLFSFKCHVVCHNEVDMGWFIVIHWAQPTSTLGQVTEAELNDSVNLSVYCVQICSWTICDTHVNTDQLVLPQCAFTQVGQQLRKRARHYNGGTL